MRTSQVLLCAARMRPACRRPRVNSQRAVSRARRAAPHRLYHGGHCRVKAVSQQGISHTLWMCTHMIWTVEPTLHRTHARVSKRNEILHAQVNMQQKAKACTHAGQRGVRSTDVAGRVPNYAADSAVHTRVSHRATLLAQRVE